jgi:CYTH domain-containing protein
MGVEIERKFLVHADRLPALPPPDELTQGYLSVEPVVRVRLRLSPQKHESAELTIKGGGLVSRAEFNYAIPPDDARSLLELCAGRRLWKQRHALGRWEVDHFPDLRLWLAEIELASEDEPFDRPAWLGEEVSHDPSYSNAQLAARSP